MVKKIRAIGIISFFSWFVCANDEEIFLRAHKMYAAHEYDHALSLYEKIPHKGRAVLYNIGNCYFHKNNYAYALVYWERAKKGATSQEYASIMQNKDCVLEKLNKVNTQTFYHQLREWLHSIYLYISPFFVQLLFFLLWGILLFLYHKRRLKVIRIALVLMLILLACVMFFHHIERLATYGIITKKRTELYAGPDKGFDILGTVEYADFVNIKEKRQGWYKVSSSDIIGWIEANAIEII